MGPPSLLFHKKTPAALGAFNSNDARLWGSHSKPYPGPNPFLLRVGLTGLVTVHTSFMV